MNEPYSLVLTASDEIDECVLDLVDALRSRTSHVMVVAPGYPAVTEVIQPYLTVRRVTLCATIELAPSSQAIRPLRIAHNLLVLNPVRRMLRWMSVDWRWVFLRYPEFVEAMEDVCPSHVVSDGLEVFGAARRIAEAHGAALVLHHRDPRDDQRTGMRSLCWFHLCILRWRLFRRARHVERVYPIRSC